MARIFIPLFLCLLCFSCSDNPSKESPSTAGIKDLPVSLLSGYFLNNTVERSDAMAFYVIDDQAEFEKYFGVAKTMTNEITQVDFKTERVGALIHPDANNEVKISVNKLQREGEKAMVDFSVSTGAPQSFTISPVVLFKLPGDADLKSVDLLQDGHKVMNVPVKK